MSEADGGGRFARAMWTQGPRDLARARVAQGAGDFEWACAAARQAAGKSVKAVLLHAGLRAEPTHSLPGLFSALVGSGVAMREARARLNHPLSARVMALGSSRYPLTRAGRRGQRASGGDHGRGPGHGRGVGCVSPAARHRARLRDATIARLAAHLVAHPPAPGTRRIVLFGSLARGDSDGASDADLPMVGRSGALDPGIHSAAGRGCDVIPWTAEQWHGALKRGHLMALDIVREGGKPWPTPPRAEQRA